MKKIQNKINEKSESFIIAESISRQSRRFSFSNIIGDLKNSKLTVLFLCFTIFIFSLTLYIKTTKYNISGMDDDVFVNFSFDKYSIKDIFTKNVYLDKNAKTYYRPVLSLSFMVDNFVNQSPTVMHSTNIILHALCAVLLFIFLKRYFFNNAVSFFTALFFVAHPINVFTAAWIPGRNDSLMCVFFLLSLIFFMEYLNKDKIKFLVLFLFSFSATLFTKEVSIIFPAVYAAFWFINNKGLNKKFYKVFAAQFVMVAGFLLLYASFSYNPANSHGQIALMFSNFKTLFDYYSSVYIFNIHLTKYISNKTFILGLISVLMNLLFLYFSGLKIKEKLLYFIFPVIMLMITLLAGQMFFQGNRLYIPIIFMIIPFLYFLKRFLNDKMICAVLIGLTAVSVGITLKYQKFFENEISYFGTIDREQPNYEIVMSNLYSYNLLKYGKFEEAAAKAREINELTENKNIYNKYVLSIVYIHEKKYNKAVELLERITNFDKDVYTKLTVCYDILGDKEKSLYYYKILLNLNNGDVRKTNELIAKEKNVSRKN